MTEPGYIEPTVSPITITPTIALWTPKNIFWLGFFLGWPTALVLCIINWFRMGLRKKALIFSGGGLVAVILFFSASSTLPGGSGTVPMLILNLVLLAFFQSLMSNDFFALGYTSTSYRQAGIGWGILIGLITLVGIFGSIFVIIFVIEMIKIIQSPNPITPLPGETGWIRLHL